LWGSHDSNDAWWGLIPAGLGIAYLLSAWWDRRERARAPTGEETAGAERAHSDR